MLQRINKEASLISIDKISKSIQKMKQGDYMNGIKKEELLKNLKGANDQTSAIDMDAVDFVLLKLNEIKYEVSLKLKDHENITKKKSVS